MSTRTLSIPKTLHRQATFDRGAINEEERTVELTISSEAPYDRYWGTEILDHSRSAVDMAQLQSGAPALFNHNRDAHLGTILEARNDGKNLRIKVKFSQSAFAQEKWQDVKDGILMKSSVGYEIREMELEKEEKGHCTYRVTAWCPMEGSLVTLPADWSTGVGKSADDASQNREILIREKNAVATTPETGHTRAMSESAATNAQTVNVIEERNAAVTAERKRVQDIQERSTHFLTKGLAGRLIDTTEAAQDFIRSGKSVDEFQNAVILGNFKEVRSVDTNGKAPSEGMSEKDMSKYSLVRAMSRMANKLPLDGFERELSDETGKLLGRSTSGFFIPNDIMQRALVTNVFNAAGAIVSPTGPQGQPMIELLRNKMKVVAMGARVLSGLQGNLAIPSQTGGATAYWLPENGTITATDQTVGQVSLTPHRLGAATAYTLQLLAQASIDVESFVRTDLMTVLALAQDKAALMGTGTAGEPQGIVNTTGLSTSVTLANAGTITYAEALRFETNVANNNADEGSLGYLTTPTVRAGTKATAEIAAANSIPVWRDGRVNGYRAETTLQNTSASTVIFGNWNDLMIGNWAGQEVIVDPYSLSLQGQVRIVIQMLCDVAIRHAVSFSKSTN